MCTSTSLQRSKGEEEESLELRLNFRDLRKRARLTMREAAKVSGVSESTICNVEKGTHRPQARTFDALLETYRARIQYLRDAVA